MSHCSPFQQRRHEGGGIELVMSQEGMPGILIEAKRAVDNRQIEQARECLNDNAITSIRQHLQHHPDRTDIMFLTGLLLEKTGRLHKAEQWYREILKQVPNALVWHELGRIYRRSGRISKATQCRREAVALDPENGDLWIAFALDLIREGHVQQGIEWLRRTLKKNPDSADVHSKLLFYLHYLPNPDRQALFEEHRRWGGMHAPEQWAKPSHPNEPDQERRLRIGYISPDFRTHSVAYNFEAILAGRNRNAMEVYGYGNVAVPDQMTEHLAARFDRYRDIRNLDDQTVVRLIEQDRIDILVSIAGHIEDNRLTLMAYKPAPIQVEYHGINTSGMKQIDYRITDQCLDPPGSQAFCVEELFHLKTYVHCYTPALDAPPISPLPALDNGFVTFGSFNNNRKINAQVIALWSQVLKANKGSRLVVKFTGADDPVVRDHYLKQFAEHGIPAERIDMLGWKSKAEHYTLYGTIDIALDTYPFNGCMTTLEGMWMGVPMVSLYGDLYVSRMGLSILRSAGLGYFATPEPAAFVAKATALAHNTNALARIRASMRNRMTQHPVCNAKAYAKAIEEAYREMWRQWCNRQGATVQVHEGIQKVSNTWSSTLQSIKKNNI